MDWPEQNLQLDSSPEKQVPLKQVSGGGWKISNNNQSKTNNPEWKHSDFHHRV